MLVRMRVSFLMIILVASLATAGDKKKVLLPVYVLQAKTVLVIIDPDAGISMTAPQANKTAQDDVEKALMKWHRLSPVMPGMPADLVITVRKGSGKIVQPTIGGEPTNDRPVVVQPTDSGVRIGVQQGRPPDATQSGPQDTRAHPQMEAAPPTTCLRYMKAELAFIPIVPRSGTITPRTRCARRTFPQSPNSEKSSKPPKNNKKPSLRQMFQRGLADPRPARTPRM